MKTTKSELRLGRLMLLPAFILILVFVIFPLLYTLYLSFFDWNMVGPNKTFVGLNNYVSIFKDKQMIKVFSNTMIYILILLVLNFILPYIFAFITNYVLKKHENIFKVGFFLPSFISLVVASMLFTWILNPVSGPISIIANWLGISLPYWTTTEGVVIVVISLISSWKLFGYNFIVLYAAVTGVSPEIIEAAQLDDISLFNIFTDIVVPSTSASAIYILIMTIVQGLQDVYTPIATITKGGPNNSSSNLIYQAYQEAFMVFRSGRAAALSILTLIIFAILLALEFYFVERKVHYEN